LNSRKLDKIYHPLKMSESCLGKSKRLPRLREGLLRTAKNVETI
jgi:hypothetical protein